MHLFNCITKQKRRRRTMPCTNCMVEYTRTRKEYGCAKCGFGFCQKCLPYKCAIPSLSTKPVFICANCNALLNKKDSTRISKTEKTREFSLPSDGQFWNAAGEQPPPSLRSLYAQQSKKPAFSGQTAKSNSDEWAELEARLRRLNEPIEKNIENATTGNQATSSTTKKRVPEIEELEERLAALRGLPVDLIRNPRLLVMNEDGEENDVIMNDEAQELLRQAESGIRINQSQNSSKMLSATNDDFEMRGESDSISSAATQNSSAESAIIRKTINEIETANSSTSDLSRAASEQFYPNFADCIRKTLDDAAKAEREAIEFLHQHGEAQNVQPEIQPTGGQDRTAEQTNKPKDGKLKFTRFFR